ncbi:unnamed protein product [Gongylonema pulchrum]|uniref:C2H2-type domain-containing protein n=1 Tax=Gongylonema pulchrum TaxID=637853 RepID=A0A183CYN9_9BILA|nr:unnamed protein product [Gongylonema pulchrum]
MVPVFGEIVADRKRAILRPVSGSSRSSKENSRSMHSCPFCAYRTPLSQRMRSHLAAHENCQEQMYECDECLVQFTEKSNMLRHRLQHSGIKPCRCKFCPKTFFRNDQVMFSNKICVFSAANFQ